MGNEEFPTNEIAILQFFLQFLSILKFSEDFINTFPNLRVDNVQFVEIMTACILQYGKHLQVPYILQFVLQSVKSWKILAILLFRILLMFLLFLFTAEQITTQMFNGENQKFGMKNVL